MSSIIFNKSLSHRQKAIDYAEEELKQATQHAKQLKHALRMFRSNLKEGVPLTEKEQAGSEPTSSGHSATEHWNRQRTLSA